MYRNDTSVARRDTDDAGHPVKLQMSQRVSTGAPLAPSTQREPADPPRLPTRRRIAMRHLRTTLALLFAALAPLALASCDGDPSGPDARSVPEDRLTFLRAAEGAPPLERNEVSFWVTQDDGGRAELRYVGGYDCLEFRVPNDALLRGPNGERYDDDDSVRITVRVVDAGQFRFEFEPAGLRFDPDRPAELRISYRYADRDFDDDGVIDDDDSDFEFGVWRQERVGLPWSQIGTAVLKDLEEVRAEIRGFTRYAMAGE
jgi:hypothetical protein